MIDLAQKNALALSAGHSFIVHRDRHVPRERAERDQNVPEVCRIFCATANTVDVILAENGKGAALLRVIDSGPLAGRQNGLTFKIGKPCCGGSDINNRTCPDKILMLQAVMMAAGKSTRIRSR